MTSARRFESKKRNSELRKQKPIILIVAEGENVTETQYFRSFQRRNADKNIRIILAKHVTDPEGMLKALQNKWKEMSLDSRKGDKAYVVLDLDCDEKKAALISELGMKARDVEFIVSNPCFEVWFLLHYKYSTKQFYSGEAVIKELRSYIPNYEKNLDVSGKLETLEQEAIQNSDKLRKFFVNQKCRWPAIDCNPRTDADLIVRTLVPQGD